METFNLIIQIIGILAIFYIVMNRFLYYLDGDHKTRNRTKTRQITNKEYKESIQIKNEKK